jgi:hypothetical protein
MKIWKFKDVIEPASIFSVEWNGQSHCAYLRDGMKIEACLWPPRSEENSFTKLHLKMTLLFSDDEAHEQ